MKKWMMATAACAFLAVACDKDDDNELNDADRTFVSMASISNNAEIMAGQLAATKGSNSMVKSFGQLMVTEHTMAQQDLKGRASSAGLTAADTVDAEHKLLMTRLNGLTGYSFDTAYINAQVKDHAKTLDIFNIEINGGSYQSIRSYATEYQPHIQMHYNKADSIRRVL